MRSFWQKRLKFNCTFDLWRHLCRPRRGRRARDQNPASDLKAHSANWVYVKVKWRLAINTFCEPPLWMKISWMTKEERNDVYEGSCHKRGASRIIVLDISFRKRSAKTGWEMKIGFKQRAEAACLERWDRDRWLVGSTAQISWDFCLAAKDETPLTQQLAADAPSNMQLNLHLLPQRRPVLEM